MPMCTNALSGFDCNKSFKIVNYRTWPKCGRKLAFFMPLTVQLNILAFQPKCRGNLKRLVFCFFGSFLRRRCVQTGYWKLPFITSKLFVSELHSLALSPAFPRSASLKKLPLHKIVVRLNEENLLRIQSSAGEKESHELIFPRDKNEAKGILPPFF